MSNLENLESPRANSSRGFGGIENGESSDATAQLSTPNAGSEFLGESQDDLSSFGSMFWEDIASEDDRAAPIKFVFSCPPESTRNDLKKEAAKPNHKGVHFRQKNKKFVARLCLPGGRNRKLELGEYNTHDEAARAFHVGAFYYNKSCTSDCREDGSFLETLPCLPDNLSDAGKLAWVRERARHSAASMIDTLETLRTFPLKRLRSWSSSFDERPSTPASYGTQGSCDDHHSTPTTPTTSGSAHADNSFGGSSMKEPLPLTVSKWWDDAPFFDKLEDMRRLDKEKSVAPHDTSESKRRRCFPTRSQGSLYLELQQGRNFNALTNQTPVVDHQADSQVKMTDSILFALFELRKQGWEWTLKLRNSSSVEAGVLFSVPEGQHAAPALRITDIITNSFHELREQGWEVHLQPHGRGKAELRSELCVAPTGVMAQDELKVLELLSTELREAIHSQPGTHFQPLHRSADAYCTYAELLNWPKMHESPPLEKTFGGSCTKEEPSTMRPFVKELNVDDYHRNFLWSSWP